jgi:hypothetical protein
MKKTNLLVSLTMLLCFVAFSCDSTVESKNETTAETNHTLASLLTDDECFDQKMEKWFVEFNQLQDKGLDMNEANTKAIASVNLQMKNCTGETTLQTAGMSK